MGADLCTWYLWKDKDRILDWDAGREKLKEMALSLLDEDQRDDEETLDATILGESSCYNYAELEQALEEAHVIVEGSPRRDTSHITFAHLDIWETGGMSWGDDPTDTYSIFQRVCDVPEVLEVIGLNQDDINYKDILMKVLKLNPDILPTLVGVDPNLDKIIEKDFKE